MSKSEQIASIVETLKMHVSPHIFHDVVHKVVHDLWPKNEADEFIRDNFGKAKIGKKNVYFVKKANPFKLIENEFSDEEIEKLSLLLSTDLMERMVKVSMDCSEKEREFIGELTGESIDRAQQKYCN